MKNIFITGKVQTNSGINERITGMIHEDDLAVYPLDVVIDKFMADFTKEVLEKITEAAKAQPDSE